MRLFDASGMCGDGYEGIGVVVYKPMKQTPAGSILFLFAGGHGGRIFLLGDLPGLDLLTVE